MSDKTYPYFDYLLSQFKNDNRVLEKSFGRHVHWGYWQDPSLAHAGAEDYAAAAENLTRKICASAQIHDNQSVLDVGCGFGGTLAWISEHHHGMDLTGVNNDPRQLERAAKLVGAGPDNRITFTEADACALPYADLRFDRILAIECIFHFSSREKFFEESHRLLKTGGNLTLSDFIPVTAFLPAAWILSIPALQKNNAFGACNITCSLNQYATLAGKYGFEFNATDITIHTLPTYDYLQTVFQASKSNVNLVIPFIRLVSRRGLLTYQILSFRKK